MIGQSAARCARNPERGSGAWYKTLMARLIYSVAASLDAFIAGPQGDYDWLPMDPVIDFVEMYRSISRNVLARRTLVVYIVQRGSTGTQLLHPRHTLSHP